MQCGMLGIGGFEWVPDTVCPWILRLVDGVLALGLGEWALLAGALVALLFAWVFEYQYDLPTVVLILIVPPIVVTGFGLAAVIEVYLTSSTVLALALEQALLVTFIVAYETL